MGTEIPDMKLFLKIIAGLVGLIIVLAIIGWRVPDFVSKPAPAKSYAGALAQFEALQKSEAELPLGAAGKSRIFVHGAKTQRVFVLLHGLTNAPEQFVPMAKILFDEGANVVIPRARYAGFADLLNDGQGLQSGQDLLDQAAVGLDIAAGLGERVTLVGLSGSAVAAAWMGQHRDGIDSLVLLAPFFTMQGKMTFVVDVQTAALSVLPNFYIWWNPELRERNPGPPQAYPRFGTRTMAGTLQLSRSVRANADSAPLRVRNLDIVVSGSDRAVENSLARRLAGDWLCETLESVTFFEFPEADGVPHDMIDPLQPEAQTEVSYAKILSLPGMQVP